MESVDATIKTIVAIFNRCSTVSAMGKETSDEAATANLPFGELVIQSLNRLGVSHFVISPGSRSTPLSLAAAALPDERVSIVLDERSAGFRALGIAKASGKPVALICTSGTAGAHYFPAVIEARESGIPLLVMTADRPPESRHCHSGQTIDQLKLFGSYPLFHAEMPLPECDRLLLRQVREICRNAVESSVGWPAGPVHLNFPFREPFFDPQTKPVEVDTRLLDGLNPVIPCENTSTIKPSLPERTLILAGPRPGLDSAEELQAIIELSKRGGFPILADGANPLRYHAECDAIIHYDRLVRDDDLWQCLLPDAVVMWGEPPTSKLLRQRLESLDVTGYRIGQGKRAINPIQANLQWAGSSVSGFLAALEIEQGTYKENWDEADIVIEQFVLAAMDSSHPLFEGDIHRALAELLPASAAVFYASSMAIRDAEWFMPNLASGLRPFSQRGANGIDGLLSTARGISHGLGTPAWVVTGDLAFLHDGNGLLGSSDDKHGLFVVLMNNHGGGIFEFLPVASQSDAFERVFATPQQVDFAGLVHAHGGIHHLCESREAFEKCLRDWDGKGLVVAEIPVDRKESAALHRQFINLTSQESS